MVDSGDVRLQLDDLEAEEALIMRELREMDAKQEAKEAANNRRADQIREDPEAALAALLLECEKEVRDAKGYIADQGPPLKIVRLKHGETGPRSATYLSRPRNTGVDFTVPVTLKAYTDLIKNPIFLNQIRDKIKSRKYRSVDDYLGDMRLLVRNTAQFNKGPDLAWVVQHAKFLLEAAEDAIQARRHAIHQVEQALQQQAPAKPSKSQQGALAAVGKRKRAQPSEKANGDIAAVPAVGSAIEIYWHPYRKWYLAYITDRGEGATVHVRYQEDNSEQWVDLNHERWRMRNSRSAASRAKRAPEPASKRRKSGGSVAVQQSEATLTAGPSITPEDLDSIKIDLFAKFEDLRDSINDNLRQHLDRVDRAVARSDALTRILVQLGDTQASVETAVTTLFDKFEKLERKFEVLLQSHARSNVQQEVEEEEKEKDKGRVLDDEDQKEKEGRGEGKDSGNKERLSGNTSDQGKDMSLGKKERRREEIQANEAPTMEKPSDKEVAVPSPIQISDDDQAKDCEKPSPMKDNASHDHQGNSIKEDDSKTSHEKSTEKDKAHDKYTEKDKAHDKYTEKDKAHDKYTEKDKAHDKSVNVDRTNESENGSAMDIDELPPSSEIPSVPRPKGEKSPVTGAGRKQVSADIDEKEVPSGLEKKKDEQQAKQGDSSEDGSSSGSSSGSDDSDASDSDGGKAQGFEKKPNKTAAKEPRKSKPSRFSNRVDIEGMENQREESQPDVLEQPSSQKVNENGAAEHNGEKKEELESSPVMSKEDKKDITLTTKPSPDAPKENVISNPAGS
ncbi:Protein lin-49 [Gracilariopsis chorda]|uniref:Protein lin-49 n=1 Tax=Gracilariopsis chorda TaxID=448386 RepID=A0A2V3IJ46_9FLOR|nr:Protein lin-49 [Gracilariopsis chorda]|eukprot:PXF42092.1 Protein lin-49 [Gracilariopsis chorda]